MAFQVEISLHIHHTEPIGKISGTLIDLAERMQCYRHYIRHKTAKKPYIRIRNHVILTLFFPEKESKIIYFLIQLKNMSGVHIESISYEHDISILLYASKVYLSRMETNMVKQYQMDKAKLLTSEFKSIVQAAE